VARFLDWLKVKVADFGWNLAYRWSCLGCMTALWLIFMVVRHPFAAEFGFEATPRCCWTMAREALEYSKVG
jgi:hypothetical protein